MIVDSQTVYFRAGDGGEGCSSLINFSVHNLVGDGGDGGKGGDVILKVSPHFYDLSKFRGNKRFVSENGKKGDKNNKKGRDGSDLIVYVPDGTRVVKDDKCIVDLAGENKEFLICRGGRGGKGNYKREYTVPAHEGEEITVILDYRIPVDAVILGFSNSGKTALFNALTGQKCKVAEYPFTTNSCFWAKCEYDSGRFTVMDTPPLKKRKNSGDDIENSFLKHVYRSKVLLLLSDDCSGFKEDFAEIEEEIHRYDPELLKNKNILYLLTKIDRISKKIEPGKEFNVVSIKDGQGLDELRQKINDSLPECD